MHDDELADWWDRHEPPVEPDEVVELDKVVDPSELG